MSWSLRPKTEIMRDAFSRALVAAARKDSRILLLTGDHGYSLFDNFRHACPDQYINAGIAEQNMVSVAAGLAKGGFRPVVYGLSAFVPMRVLEQIKLDICYEELPVILIGDGAGVVYSTLGTSHQSTEDISALRALPHLRILSPGDAGEMTAALELAFDTPAPIYFRIGKSDLHSVHAAPPHLRWGSLVPVQAGSGPLALVATGSLLPAAVALSRHFTDCAVWSAPVLKPLDAASVLEALQPNVVLATLEEHSVFGGLGSAVAEIFSEHRPLPVCRIGVPDQFSRICGSYPHLLREHRLDFDSLRSRLHAFLRQHGFSNAISPS